MKYTRVRRAVSAVMIDSYDEDRNPELVKVNGTVTFTPLLKDGDVVQWAGPNGPQSLVLAPIECFISNGIIMHRGGEGIFLAAGGPGVQPDVIQWKATFKNMQAGGWAFTLKPVMFDAVPDGEVDLTLVSPIAGASEPILRGPAGVGLKSITVEGSELVVTVTSEAGTYVMSRIPLEDVVRAEADQAVASAQAAIKADVDAAATLASNAKQSETNAGDYAAVATTAATEAVDAMEEAARSAAAFSIYTGTGFPEGKVAAPVGSVYTDSAATNGAIRWIKASGTGNTGWRVEYGDTGWRDLTHLLSDAWSVSSGGYVRIRRSYNTVMVAFKGLQSTAGSNGNTVELPVGFRPIDNPTAVEWPADGYQKDRYSSASTWWLRISGITEGAITAPGVVNVLSFPAAAVWPSSLPGNPA